jgi:hypothetical protein
MVGCSKDKAGTRSPTEVSLTSHVPVFQSSPRKLITSSPFFLLPVTDKALCRVAPGLLPPDRWFLRIAELFLLSC